MSTDPNAENQKKKREANLIKFVPGCAPGPGRPKGSVSIKTFMKRLLAENDDAKARDIAESWLLLAAKGHPLAMKWVMELDETRGDDAELSISERAGRIVALLDRGRERRDRQASPEGPGGADEYSTD